MNDIAAANLLKQLSGLFQKGYLTNIVQFLHCHTNLLFIKLKNLKISDNFKLKLLKLFYKLSYNLLPLYFDRYRDIIE